MKGTDWNNNGRIDAGDWYIDYEIMNDNNDNAPDYTYSPKKKKSRRPNAQEMEAHDRFLRKLFIVLGTLFALALLEENISWYRFDPSYARLWEVILSLAILVIIGRNIWKHRKAKKSNPLK